MKPIFLGFFITFIFSIKSFSYESMIRHGYFACIACHNSTGGGGDLNEYGKSISSSVSVFQQRLKANKWLKNFSPSMQTRLARVKREGGSEARIFPMQWDFLGTLKVSKRIDVLTTLARFPGEKEALEARDMGRYSFRKLLLVYRLKNNLYIEAGKNHLPQGIYTTDHTSFIRGFNRRGLGDLATQASVTYYTNNNRHSLYILNTEKNEEKELAFAVKEEFYLRKANTLLGFDLLRGTTNGTDSSSSGGSRYLGGLYFKTFLNKQFVILGELNYSKEEKSSSSEIKQRATFVKLSYFPKDFWELYITKENLNRETTRTRDLSKTTLGSLFKLSSNLSFLFEIKNQDESKTYIAQLFLNLW